MAHSKPTMMQFSQHTMSTTHCSHLSEVHQALRGISVLTIINSPQMFKISSCVWYSWWVLSTCVDHVTSPDPDPTVMVTHFSRCALIQRHRRSGLENFTILSNFCRTYTSYNNSNPLVTAARN